jgi:hypothetical protein
MSVQRNGATATSAVAELTPKGGAVRGRPVVRAPRDDQLPDPLVDELADKLSNRLADRLADRRVGRMADLANRDEEDRNHVPRVPDGAKYATVDQLAARYQLSVRWVESRAANLGATPISDTTNSKLRYHLATADAYMEATPSSDPGSRHRRPQAQAAEADSHPYRATAARRRVNRLSPALRRLPRARPRLVPARRDRAERSAGRPRASSWPTCDRPGPSPSAGCGPPTPNTSSRSA